MQKIRLIIKKKNAKTSKTLFLFFKKNALIKKKRYLCSLTCVYTIYIMASKYPCLDMLGGWGLAWIGYDLFVWKAITSEGDE